MSITSLQRTPADLATAGKVWARMGNRIPWFPGMDRCVRNPTTGVSRVLFAGHSICTAAGRVWLCRLPSGLGAASSIEDLLTGFAGDEVDEFPRKDLGFGPFEHGDRVGIHCVGGFGKRNCSDSVPAPSASVT